MRKKKKREDELLSPLPSSSDCFDHIFLPPQNCEPARLPSALYIVPTLTLIELSFRRPHFPHGPRRDLTSLVALGTSLHLELRCSTTDQSPRVDAIGGVEVTNDLPTAVHIFVGVVRLSFNLIQIFHFCFTVFLLDSCLACAFQKFFVADQVYVFPLQQFSLVHVSHFFDAWVSLSVRAIVLQLQPSPLHLGPSCHPPPFHVPVMLFCFRKITRDSTSKWVCRSRLLLFPVTEEEGSACCRVRHLAPLLLPPPRTPPPAPPRHGHHPPTSHLCSTTNTTTTPPRPPTTNHGAIHSRSGSREELYLQVADCLEDADPEKAATRAEHRDASLCARSSVPCHAVQPPARTLKRKAWQRPFLDRSREAPAGDVRAHRLL